MRVRVRRETVSTEAAPAAIGPYSQALRTDRWLFCSGQIALDPTTGELVEGEFEEQARQVFDNLEAVLGEAGLGFGDVVKVTVYLADLEDFPELNEIYAGRFSEPYPARAVIEVSALPKDAEVEIELVAMFAD